MFNDGAAHTPHLSLWHSSAITHSPRCLTTEPDTRWVPGVSSEKTLGKYLRFPFPSKSASVFWTFANSFPLREAPMSLLPPGEQFPLPLGQG